MAKRNYRKRIKSRRTSRKYKKNTRRKYTRIKRNTRKMSKYNRKKTNRRKTNRGKTNRKGKSKTLTMIDVVNKRLKLVMKFKKAHKKGVMKGGGPLEDLVRDVANLGKALAPAGAAAPVVVVPIEV